MLFITGHLERIYGVTHLLQ